MKANHLLSFLCLWCVSSQTDLHNLVASDFAIPQDISKVSPNEFGAKGTQDTPPMLLQIQQAVKVVRVSADIFLDELMAEWSNDVKPMLLELPQAIKSVPVVLLECIFFAFMCMGIFSKPCKHRSCKKSREVELAAEVDAKSQPPQECTLTSMAQEFDDSEESTSSGASSASDEAVDTAGRPYRVGDAVILWNHSTNKWSDNGIVLEVSQESIKVEFDGGLSRMIVPVDILQHMVRRREPVLAPTHTERAVLVSQDASKTLLHTYSGAPIASNEAIQPVQSIEATQSEPCVLPSPGAPEALVQNYFGAPMTSCELVDTEGRPYRVGDAVSLWKHGADKWSDDGVVLEICQDSLKVEFDGGSSRLIVPVHILQHMVRRREPALAQIHTERSVMASPEATEALVQNYSGAPMTSCELVDTEGRPYGVGDAVSLWNHNADKWSDDGVVLEISQDSLKVEFDGGSSRLIVPVHILQHMVRRREPALAQIHTWQSVHATHTEQSVLTSPEAPQTQLQTCSGAPMTSCEHMVRRREPTLSPTRTALSMQASQEASKTPHRSYECAPSAVRDAAAVPRRYLPRFLQGVEVIVALGQPGKFALNNLLLKAKTRGIAYRLSMALQDIDPDESMTAFWGTVVTGEIIGDWLQVDLDTNQALAPTFSPQLQTSLHIAPPQRQQAAWQQATPRDEFAPRLG